MSGITPSMRTNTNMASAYDVPIDIQCFTRAMMAARPWGTRFTARAIPREISQQRYIPMAAVYSSCGRAGVSEPVLLTALGGGAMLDEPIDPRAIP
uniref:Uncharacterized protein n=1 Tax=Anopheles christyi TaxID=43041 RepID=A0A182KIF0_9DIPT